MRRIVGSPMLISVKCHLNGLVDECATYTMHYASRHVGVGVTSYAKAFLIAPHAEAALGYCNTKRSMSCSGIRFMSTLFQ